MLVHPIRLHNVPGICTTAAIESAKMIPVLIQAVDSQTVGACFCTRLLRGNGVGAQGIYPEETAAVFMKNA